VAYPRANAVVVQTPEVRRWAEGFLPDRIVHTIPNPVLWPPASPNVENAGRGSFNESPRVVAAGRLDPLKGFDVLLLAFAKCRERFPDWKLTIVGEGPERARLEGLVQQLELTNAVSMPGRVQHLYPTLRAADLFVLSSRSEGFPNVLLEAMASGVAVVATDCPSGPRHIVRDGIDGLLVPPESVDSLATAMSALMGDATQRRALAARAEEVRERFSVERVMGEWERLIDYVAPAALRQQPS
jgi:glycosyltransferase involved in cell wall biosynthesis